MPRPRWVAVELVLEKVEPDLEMRISPAAKVAAVVKSALVEPNATSGNSRVVATPNSRQRDNYYPPPLLWSRD